MLLGLKLAWKESLNKLEIIGMFKKSCDSSDPLNEKDRKAETYLKNPHKTPLTSSKHLRLCVMS